MSITPISGIIKDGRIKYQDYTGGAPTGGTAKGDKLWYSDASSYYLYAFSSTYPTVSWRENGMIDGDYLLARNSTVTIATGGYTSITPGGQFTNTNGSFLYVGGTLGAWDGNKQLLLSVQTDVMSSPDIHTCFQLGYNQNTAAKMLFNKDAINNSFIPRILTSTSVDYISSPGAGKYLVVYFEDFYDTSLKTSNPYGGSTYPNWPKPGLWKAYEFNSESQADVFLDTVFPPILGEIVIPGPHIVIIVGDPDTGVITGVIVTDDGGTVLDDGSIVVTGDIYTGGDIPSDIVGGFVIPVTNPSTLTDLDVLPRMWRTRTSVDFPGDTQGHEPLYLCKGVSMLELKGKRMKDIYRRMPTTNPNTRD